MESFTNQNSLFHQVEKVGPEKTFIKTQKHQKLHLTPQIYSNLQSLSSLCNFDPSGWQFMLVKTNKRKLPWSHLRYYDFLSCSKSKISTFKFGLCLEPPNVIVFVPHQTYKGNIKIERKTILSTDKDKAEHFWNIVQEKPS